MGRSRVRVLRLAGRQEIRFGGRAVRRLNPTPNPVAGTRECLRIEYRCLVCADVRGCKGEGICKCRQQSCQILEARQYGGGRVLGHLMTPLAYALN